MILKKIDGTPDFHLLIDLINAAWPEEWGDSTEQDKVDKLIESHNEETDTIKYLLSNDEIIGWYRYSLHPRDNRNTKIIHLYDIAVLPSFQRRGLGTYMLKDFVEECRNRDFNEVLSRSMKSNQGSIRFHESFGFTQLFETDDSIVWQYKIE